MRYGFSTGALAKGDFRRALGMLEPHSFAGIEVSALRMSELPDLLKAFPSLPLDPYRGHVSVHAPSQFKASEEAELARKLGGLAPLVEGIVLHIEAIHDPAHWRTLGHKVLVENADGRKALGQTTGEMLAMLERLPDARVCLDLGHVYQVDPTQAEARRMLEALGDRVGQIHLSELDGACRHCPMTVDFAREIQQLAPSLPDTVVILETPVEAEGMAHQSELARLACGA